MRTVESPSDGEVSEPDSPELVTAAVSSIKSRPSAIPVDSPMFAQLSPKRLLKAKKVRALEEASYSVSQKAVEIMSKGFMGGEMWMLNRVAVFAIFVCIAVMVACGPGPKVQSPVAVTVAPAFPSPATTTATVPAFFEEHDVFSSAAISAHQEGVEQLGLRAREAVEKGREIVISSSKWGEAYSARFALASNFRNAHQRVVQIVREAVAIAVSFVEHQLSSFISKAAPDFLRHATRIAAAVSAAFDSAPIPGLMDTL